ncbi:hypothetical protein [Streptomyces sp. OE57]|uniref:hypothetical protein n=1 Tax=Streptomyces lacaronensis TaxID=3379885 RepID=UPI0039B731D8
MLRYDRRGAGATPGAWRATGFTDNYKDAAAAPHALAEHPAVRPDAVGHSEGALHAICSYARPVEVNPSDKRPRGKRPTRAVPLPGTGAWAYVRPGRRGSPGR